MDIDGTYAELLFPPQRTIGHFLGDDDDDVVDAGSTYALDHMSHECSARDRMRHLRQYRPHARALPRSHDDRDPASRCRHSRAPTRTRGDAVAKRGIKRAPNLDAREDAFWGGSSSMVSMMARPAASVAAGPWPLGS